MFPSLNILAEPRPHHQKKKRKNQTIMKREEMNKNRQKDRQKERKISKKMAEPECFHL
jgi:hypothetical protein